MTRDMDLIRQLLLDLEALQPPATGGLILSGESFLIEGHNAEQISYHLSLIREAGFIDDAGHRSSLGVGFRRLSWAGHDFIDATRDKTVWQKTKETASRAGGFSADLLLGIAKEVIKQNLGKLAGGVLGS